MRYCFRLLLLVCAFSTVKFSYARPSDTIPPAAHAEGYTINTFHSMFADDVDLLNLRNHGHNWYLEDFYNEPPARASQLKIDSQEGITISSGNRKELATATRYFSKKLGKNARDDHKWVGTAFGGGGYFEADIKFDPDIVFKQQKSEGWPAFWAMSIEHRAGLESEKWEQGGEGFVRFMEIDAMEYLYKDAGKKNQYGANIHHWYGVYRKTCPKGAFCHMSVPYRDRSVDVPKGTSFNNFHRYGFLWVPATDQKNGYIQFYFDGEPVNKRVEWSKYDESLPIEDEDLRSFALLDTQHIILLLGSGNDMPMTVRSVSVWQNSDDNNWVTRPE